MSSQLCFCFFFKPIFMACQSQWGEGSHQDKFQLEETSMCWSAHLRAPLAQEKRQNFEKFRENNTKFSTNCAGGPQKTFWCFLQDLSLPTLGFFFNKQEFKTSLSCSWRLQISCKFMSYCKAAHRALKAKRKISLNVQMYWQPVWP